MARCGVGLLLLLAILSCGRQSTKPPEPKEPICEVIPDTLDFGHVELGNTAERSFRVTNTGTARLQVKPWRFGWSTHRRVGMKRGAVSS
jgi:hypothetical protein